MNRQFSNAINDRRSNDEVVMTYFKVHNKIGWINKTELTLQMQIWKNMIRGGHLRILEVNTHQCYYTIAFQAVGTNADRENTIDPISKEIFKHEIRGFVYFFIDHEIRDNVIQFLMC
jgi:hypothetical protein